MCGWGKKGDSASVVSVSMGPMRPGKEPNTVTFDWMRCSSERRPAIVGGLRNLQEYIQGQFIPGSINMRSALSDAIAILSQPPGELADLDAKKTEG